MVAGLVISSPTQAPLPVTAVHPVITQSLTVCRRVLRACRVHTPIDSPRSRVRRVRPVTNSRRSTLLHVVCVRSVNTVHPPVLITACCVVRVRGQMRPDVRPAPTARPVLLPTRWRVCRVARANRAHTLLVVLRPVRRVRLVRCNRLRVRPPVCYVLIVRRVIDSKHSVIVRSVSSRRPVAPTYSARRATNRWCASVKR